MNRLTLGTGILCGLEVTSSRRKAPSRRTRRGRRSLGGARSRRPPGREYDPFKAGGGCGCGVGAAISVPGDYIVCLTYRECTADEQPAVHADDCLGQPNCQPDTIVETFALGLRPAKGAPDGFKCDTWTAHVPPADEEAGGAGKPPTVAQLREGLLQQFGAACGQIPGDACVPLGGITVVKNLDGTLSLSPVSNEPRVRIYSQAQLLELILCLAGKVAECCKDAPHTDPTPTEGASLRVNDLVVGTIHAGNAVNEVESLQRLAGAGPPKLVLPSSGPIVIAVSFNHAVDTQTLVPAVDAAMPRSVWMLKTDQAGGGADVLIPLGALAVPLDPSVWLLFMISTDRTIGNNNFFDTRARGPGALASGVYTLMLSGTDDSEDVKPRRVAITSTAEYSPAAALVLNGEYAGTFPSGTGGPGGDSFTRSSCSCAQLHAQSRRRRV